MDSIKFEIVFKFCVQNWQAPAPGYTLVGNPDLETKNFFETPIRNLTLLFFLNPAHPSASFPLSLRPTPLYSFSFQGDILLYNEIPLYFFFNF